MNAPLRIAVGSLFTECNHLVGTRLTLEDFRRTELCRGEEALTLRTGTIGGMLAELQLREASVVPLLVASACPGGPLTAECYRQLKSELLDRLKAAGPVQGVLLALHGAATAEDAGDLEGDLLAAVRQVVGPGVPIVATLDLHAHVTEEMVQQADALMAWETYPHRDAFETGQRGARMLFEILAGRCRPAMALAKVPVLVSGLHGHTDGPGPFADIMRFAKSHEGLGNVVSTSVFLVHPYLDLSGMGGGGLVIADNDPAAAVQLATEIANRYWQRRWDLEPALCTPQEALRRARQLPPGPVLLVETADCCGGGAAGDSVATLSALLAQSDESALVPVVDPAAAELCHRLGPGARTTLRLGHAIDRQWGEPISITGEVIRLSDGQFRYSGGIWDGQLGHMGQSAVFRSSQIQVLIASHATYEWAGEQYQSLGLDARSVRFIVVKNPMNYRMAYGEVARAAFVRDTPGPTPATLKHVRFQRLERPYFPADAAMCGFAPSLALHLP